MDDKPQDAPRSLAAAQHDYYCQIWQLVKLGTLDRLDGKTKAVGQLILEHPEYQYFWELPYPFARVELQEAFERVVADEGEGVNPDLHITMEHTISEQIKRNDPPEAGRAYKALVRRGADPHEARHCLGRVLSDVIWDLNHMPKGQVPDRDIYLRALRRLAKNPSKALGQHATKNQQGGCNMKMLPDEELDKKLKECDMSFQDALAMPDKTIVEVLIRGAELVTAVGAKTMFLMGELTEPRQGVMYEDELEARAAVMTFRRACTDVLSALDEGLEFFDKRRQ